MRGLSVVVGCVALVLASLPASKASADGPNRAGVVVSFEDGRSESVCVEFTEPEISGADLLSRAGLPLVAMSGSSGAAVCSIDGVGCGNPGDCFCQCHGGGCRYWAYYNLEDGGWRYSAVGSSLRKVHDGDVDGWAWGAGGIGTGAQPAASSFDAICPPLTPTPPPTVMTPDSWVEGVVAQPVATATPAPVSTARGATPGVVAVPTSTAGPSPSPTSTIVPTTGGGSSGAPTWEVALVAAVFAALAMTSLVFFRGRFHG